MYSFHHFKVAAWLEIALLFLLQCSFKEGWISSFNASIWYWTYGVGHPKSNHIESCIKRSNAVMIHGTLMKVSIS